MQPAPDKLEAFDEVIGFVGAASKWGNRKHKLLNCTHMHTGA